MCTNVFLIGTSLLSAAKQKHQETNNCIELDYDEKVEKLSPPPLCPHKVDEKCPSVCYENHRVQMVSSLSPKQATLIEICNLVLIAVASISPVSSNVASMHPLFFFYLLHLSLGGFVLSKSSIIIITKHPSFLNN